MYRQRAFRAEPSGVCKSHPLSTEIMARAEWKCLIASKTLVRFLPVLRISSALPDLVIVSVHVPILVAVSISVTFLITVPAPVPVPILCSSTDLYHLSPFPFPPHPRSGSRAIPAPVPDPVYVPMLSLFVCLYRLSRFRSRSVPITLQFSPLTLFASPFLLLTPILPSISLSPLRHLDQVTPSIGCACTTPVCVCERVYVCVFVFT